jgi:hypothetical protein
MQSSLYTYELCGLIRISSTPKGVDQIRGITPQPRPPPAARTSSPRDTSTRCSIREARWPSRPAACLRPPRANDVEKRPRPPLQRLEGVSTLPPRRISRDGTRGRARGMPAGDGSLRATGMRERVSARGDHREAPARLAPSIQAPQPSGPSTACDPRAAPPRIHRCTRRCQYAPASPLNVVDIFLLQRREVHPFPPTRVPLAISHGARPPPRRGGMRADAVRWALMRSGTPGNPKSAKPQDSGFTSEGAKARRERENARDRPSPFPFPSPRPP